MQPANNQFSGLTMPVFTAFGWAGEETAINFALSQLELFIDALYYSLPREYQSLLPYHGLDRQAQSVYLSANEVPEADLYVAFFARPMSLEMSLGLANKASLTKAFRILEKDPDTFYRLLTDLNDWSLRIQQMEYDPENETATHYQDISKDNVEELTEKSLIEIISRAAFLNSESQWITPLYVNYRLDSEKVAIMGTAVIRIVSELLAKLLPLMKLLTGQARKPKAKARPAAKPKAELQTDVKETSIRRPSEAAKLEQFTYLSLLKPLHIRRGFINLTPIHWPFFAINARTETRPVVVKYGGQVDEGSAVWHLVSNNQTRIVLSSKVQQWVEDTFGPEEHIQVTAAKIDGSIEISLASLE